MLLKNRAPAAEPSSLKSNYPINALGIKSSSNFGPYNGNLLNSPENEPGLSKPSKLSDKRRAIRTPQNMSYMENNLGKATQGERSSIQSMQRPTGSEFKNHNTIIQNLLPNGLGRDAGLHLHRNTLPEVQFIEGRSSDSKSGSFSKTEGIRSPSMAKLPLLE